MSGPRYVSPEEHRIRRIVGESQFLKECYGSVPQRFRFNNRLLFSTQDKDGEEVLMEIKE